MKNNVFYVFEGEILSEKINKYLKMGKVNDEIHYLTNNQLGVEYYRIVEKNGTKEAFMYANYDSLIKEYDNNEDDDLFNHLSENELKKIKDEPPKKKSKNK